MQGALGMLLPILIMIPLFYLMVILPENKRKKKYNSMLGSLSVNDEVLTRGGIIGKVINIKEDYLIIESGPDRARFKCTKNGVAEVLTKKEEQ